MKKDDAFFVRATINDNHAIAFSKSRALSVRHSGCYAAIIIPRYAGVWVRASRSSFLWPYSVRSALIGEIAAARTAGMMAAKNAHPASEPAATVRAKGSHDATP